ncbi:MAG TPA: response regulator transcription factor [Puia sp.]|jgi:DNA-binding NarL/FixJ family response regulator|nr:response regulator transcription factor [Puia sp.]
MPDKYSIAIVDDHILFRKSLTVLIDLFPKYKVIYDASNGKDLIAQLKENSLPDIVLMDINMPVMDGYSTTAWLRDNYPQVKVLALSTMESETAIIKMIKSGAKGYVLKDAEPEELKLAFEEVLSRGYFYNELISQKVLKSVHELTEPRNKVGLFANLSEREIEFLKLVCTELAYKEIADKLFVSVRTVEGYRDTLCEKLNLKTRVGLAMYAIKNNLVTL